MDKQANLLPGTQDDIKVVLERFYDAMELSNGWSASTLGNRVCGDATFLDRIKNGRMTPRKMAACHKLLVEFISAHKK